MIRSEDVESAIADIAAGRPVVLTDDTGGVTTGDIVFSAELATASTMAFTVRYSSGLVCAAMSGEILDRLDIPPMILQAENGSRPAFTVSVDAVAGVTSGISAADRARTVRALAESNAVPAHFHRPGHLPALRCRPGGVLAWRGRAEAAMDLVRTAGLTPVGVLVELVDDEGSVKSGVRIREFADRHDLSTVSIDSVIEYLRRREVLVDRVAKTRLPTRHGVFTAFGYRGAFGGPDIVALVSGTVVGRRSVPTWIHRECLIGDVFGTLGCTCAERVDDVLERLAATDGGVFVYVRRASAEGIGRPCRAGDASVLAEAEQILRDLGVESFEIDGGDLRAADADAHAG
ncbi:hypothetical protein ASG56_20845 [Rhodococcus sp. Leaf7]|uniref:3,4-dihydroxy-2-butanone-4-phosphate synthase n=1 Tax=unclassified Rhodococcus (in: high G+C Gram-positive bacteria) TaxID=192944 RepID=UPI0006F8316F|nr:MULTISPECIES: 3,4-dihydroxy-2-butanone-4-phosphate synthase [unclassified Rhodococcus (in: high G+C Gram-positive bacteria)]KQU01967.1 hypothetical protein ASG56_20845 [Rhodococcus sp. Leaf7]KQU38260.1 hypothetical protein ASG64_20815 [Rhodococcus sp. Leaf247]